MDCSFEFEGKNYVVGIEAYRKGGPIVLPSNIVLDMHYWGETSPPVPCGLFRREGELQLGSTPEETARLVGGTVAREV